MLYVAIDSEREKKSTQHQLDQIQKEQTKLKDQIESFKSNIAVLEKENERIQEELVSEKEQNIELREITNGKQIKIVIPRLMVERKSYYNSTTPIDQRKRSLKEYLLTPGLNAIPGASPEGIDTHEIVPIETEVFYLFNSDYKFLLESYGLSPEKHYEVALNTLAAERQAKQGFVNIEKNKVDLNELLKNVPQTDPLLELLREKAIENDPYSEWKENGSPILGIPKMMFRMGLKYGKRIPIR